MSTVTTYEGIRCAGCGAQGGHTATDAVKQNWTEKPGRMKKVPDWICPDCALWQWQNPPKK